MRCLVKNISAGKLDFPDLQLKRREMKQVDFVEKLRYYVAKGYIRIIEIYPDLPSQEKPAKSKRVKQESED
ncbi:MAG: hypothetical protein QXV60_00465 [Nitrososphaerota archaeon]